MKPAADTLANGKAAETPEQPAQAHQPERADVSELYRRHWFQLVRFIQGAFGSGPPEPEDVAQMVFRQYASLEKPEEIANPRAFLFQSARNYVIDQRRVQQVHRRFAMGADVERVQETSSEIDPERVIRGKQRLAIAAEAIKKMPARQREFFILHRIHDLSYEEIGRLKRVSGVYVRRLVMDAALQCKEAIQKAEGGEA